MAKKYALIQRLFNKIIFAVFAVAFTAAVGYAADKDDNDSKDAKTVTTKTLKKKKDKTSIHVKQTLPTPGTCLIISSHGRFLQAHADNGELHASNESYGTEEIWTLIRVPGQRPYRIGLQNYDTRAFISKKVDGCAWADGNISHSSTIWTLIPGEGYGAPDKFALRSVDSTFLGANAPGDDTKCGGEVSAESSAGPPMNQPNWAGWWKILKMSSTDVKRIAAPPSAPPETKKQPLK